MTKCSNVDRAREQGTESEEEACNIDDKKPLLKFERPAASARCLSVPVLIRIFIITALMHTFITCSLCIPPHIKTPPSFPSAPLFNRVHNGRRVAKGKSVRRDGHPLSGTYMNVIKAEKHYPEMQKLFPLIELYHLECHTHRFTHA